MRRAIASSRAVPRSKASGSIAWIVPALALPCLSAFAVRFFFANGWLQFYGDAEAHLDIARAISDSASPYNQFGNVWLPLPHLLMLPFARITEWWHSGIAAAPPSALAFVIGGIFLYAAVRRIFDSTAAALTATALAALNPNLLYLQSTSMNEAIFFAELMALLYFTVRFRQSQSWASVAAAACAACAATLTRYEGWFLLPFVAGYFLIAARGRRFGVALLFSLIAGLGPLYWLAHNWYLTGDALDFYRGPYSPRAIQGTLAYKGQNDWPLALQYFAAAAQYCAGPALPLIAMAGAVIALARRVFWPVLLLLLPPVFYVWSIHSAGLPIYVPHLWPFTYYNTRYGIAALPLLAVAGSAVVMVVPRVLRAPFAVLAITAGIICWAAHPQPSAWITFTESRINSEERRAWTREAAEFLTPRYVRGSGIISNFGDMAGIYRAMPLPLSETLTDADGLQWTATLARPDLWLKQQWAIVSYTPGKPDPLRSAIERLNAAGIRYDLVKAIAIKNAPVIEIYRYDGGRLAPPPL